MEPLASLLRPKSLDEFIGQTHLVGTGKPLRHMYDKKHLFSMIFWGPPGVGKTTLAMILANQCQMPFFRLSAVSAKKEEIKALIGTESPIINNQPSTKNHTTVLFLDEIHRFSKAQQDFLLPYVENGKLLLIGATTENPSFEVISPLLSRCRVFILKELGTAEINQIIDRSLEFLSQSKKIKIETEAREWLVNMSNGDARSCITMLENTYQLYKKINITTLKNTLSTSLLRYDRKGQEHYNTISAFIKSMRAGNADAALYYLARMVSAGEDPKFIARRMIIFASEDIGLAVPTAVVVANGIFDAVTKIGYPEAQILLAHATVYLAGCKKDRRCYESFFLAMADVKTHGNLPIPIWLLNSSEKTETQNGGNPLLPTALKDKTYLV